MRYLTYFFLVLLWACKSNQPAAAQSAKAVAPNGEPSAQPNDTSFVKLADYAQGFRYDMKYATKDNFLKVAVYDCAACYLRYKTVKALLKANKAFLEKGFSIKIFDCYRPLSVQKRMFALVSNPDYVADPAKGSLHNRGGAVDLTLVDADGNELDMGTPFDFFGPKAAHTFAELPQNIRDNRRLLKETMEANGFTALKTEWWHYNLLGSANDQLADFSWECN